MRNEEIKYHVRQFAIKYLAATQYFSKAVLDHLEVSDLKRTVDDPMECILHFTFSIPSECIKSITHRVWWEAPATWWQMFKQRYFPKYLLGKYPVIMKDHYRYDKIDVFAMLPKFPEAWGKQAFMYMYEYDGSPQMLTKDELVEEEEKDEEDRD